jgi:hypothetical protein
VRPRGAARLAAAGLLLIVVSTGCGRHGLSFVRDDRLEIVAPLDRGQVRLPVTIRWTVKDFAVTGRTGSKRPDAGYFGVYVDRAPQPSGETFRWFAKDDHQCKVTPGCPDRTYYASKNVYDTTNKTFTITRLPDLRAEEARRFREFHEVAIVLLDGEGERIGERAFSVQFELKRERT